ncbi:MAG: hypothetical protein KDA70_02875 [Planctomycetaceae bacterium]|nr:hypothetical protein [Planctomycetaceae bacterium]
MHAVRFTRNLWAVMIIVSLGAGMFVTGCGSSGGSPPSSVSDAGSGSDTAAADHSVVEKSESVSNQSQTERVAYQSGMEIGEIPMPFEVADVTGPNKGKTLCYRCLYGERPVVGIFVRELDEPTTKLIQKIDSEVAAHQDEKLAAFVVMLTDTPAEVKQELEKVASENQIKHVPLTVYEGTAGPAGYNIKPDASLNVMMWEGVVKANRAWQAGQLKPEELSEVIADTRLIIQ